MAPPRQPNVKAREQNAAKRRQRFAEKQAEKPEEERMINNRKFDEEVTKQYSRAMALQMEDMKRWFIDFLQDDQALTQETGLCTSEDEAKAMFSRSGRPFSLGLIQRFLAYVAESHTGNIDSEGKISRKTVLDYLLTLQMTAKQAGNPIDKECLLAAKYFVNYKLAKEGTVSVLSRIKRIVLPADVSQLLRVLYSREYLLRFRTTREPLNLSLLLNLLVDCCGRIGEMIQSPLKDKPLLWKHTEIYAFPSMNGIVLRAILSFPELKSKTYDPNKIKRVPLRLLPVEYFAEDTLRQLVIVGLIDEVFDGVKSWEDLEKLRPEEHGTRLAIKEACLSSPVLRTVQNHTITDEPLKYQTMSKRIADLGRHAGLEHRLVFGAFRRGIAFTLAQSVSKADRCQLMGHNPRDTSYWAAYRNSLSTVDFQGIQRGHPIQDVSMLSSIFLNSSGNVPVKVSDQGLAEIASNPELCALMELKHSILSRISAKYRNVRACEIENPQLTQEWQRASYDVDNCYRILYRKKLEQERESIERFQSDAPEQQKHGAFEPLNLVTESPASKEPSSVFDLSRLMVDLDHIIASGDFGENLPAAELLMADDGNEYIDDEDDSHDGAQVSRTDEASEEVSTVPKKRAWVLTENRTVFSLFALTDDLAETIFSARFADRPTEAADYYVRMFNHLHAADDFYPGMEPLPGTYACRFCRQSFFNTARPHGHAKSCCRKYLEKDLFERLKVDFPLNTRCVCLLEDGTQCKLTTFPYRTQVRRHYWNHSKSGNSLLICQVRGCSASFITMSGYATHMMCAHKVSLAGGESGENFSKGSHTIWCGTCLEYLIETDIDVEKHLQDHSLFLLQTVQEFGHGGVTQSVRTVRHALCIFCLHDPRAHTIERLKTYTTDVREIGLHVRGHLKELVEDGAIHPCPAAVDKHSMFGGLCSCTKLMTKAELTTHLEQAHNYLGIRSVKRRGPRGPDKKGQKVMKDADNINSGSTMDVGDSI